MPRSVHSLFSRQAQDSLPEASLSVTAKVSESLAVISNPNYRASVKNALGEVAIESLKLVLRQEIL